MEIIYIIYAVIAASIIGISKGGIPGLGILSVPLLSLAFGGREAIGTMLPMLIICDIIAITWYAKFCDWKIILKLMPYIIVGMAIGFYTLIKIIPYPTTKDIIGQIIGIIIIIMVILNYITNKYPEKFIVKSEVSRSSTGIMAGFTTFTSNAAGPIMSLYLSSLKLNKLEFMGTGAWYYGIVNVTKIPFFLYLGYLYPDKPIFDINNLVPLLISIPFLFLGLFLGKHIIHKINEKLFNNIIVILALIGGLILLFK